MGRMGRKRGWEEGRKREKTKREKDGASMKARKGVAGKKGGGGRKEGK